MNALQHIAPGIAILHGIFDIVPKPMHWISRVEGPQMQVPTDELHSTQIRAGLIVMQEQEGQG